MKVLEPTVTVMLASHMKPRWLPEALDSILAQTRRDIEVVVADSAEWVGPNPNTAPMERSRMYDIYERFSRHPLVTWVTLDQRWPTPLRGLACPYAYVWNRIIDAGLVRGKYVAVFTDDDLYAPTFIERMAGYLDEQFGVDAVYCGQNRVRWLDNSWQPAEPAPAHAADRPRGPGEFLDQVDMIQVMFRSDALDQCRMTQVPSSLRGTLREIGERMRGPVFNEDPADEACRRADGDFLERLAKWAGVVPNIPEPLTTHRYTPDSTYN